MNRPMSASDTQVQNTLERYRLLVEQSTDGILVVDGDWNIQFANEAVCRMLGYTHEEMLRRNAEESYLPEDRALIPRRKEQIRTDGSAQYVQRDCGSICGPSRNE